VSNFLNHDSRETDGFTENVNLPMSLEFHIDCQELIELVFIPGMRSIFNGWNIEVIPFVIALLANLSAFSLPETLEVLTRANYFGLLTLLHF
jgi:hypothetical protein